MSADGYAPFMGRWLRAASLIGAALAALVGIGGGQALASSGCDAVNAGALSGSGPVVKAVANLEVGDTITFVITVAGAGWTLTSGNNTILNAVTSSTTVSYTVTGSHVDTTLLEIIGAGTSVTATCVGGDTRERSFERIVTRVEALASGAAISGAAGSAVAEGFSDNGGAFITQTSGGLHFNFAAEPNQTPHDRSSAFDAVMSARESVQPESGLLNNLNGPSSFAQPWRNSGRSDDPSGALGYASNPMPTKAPPLAVAPPKDWQVWADVRGTGWNTNVSTGDIVGGQVNALLGITRRITPNLLIGVLGGYETFDYASNTLDRRLKGDGWTAGGYLGWRLWPGLRFEASVARSGVSYHGFAGADAFGPAASGTFPGNRWVASTGLTGTYNLARWEIEPSAKVYALWERDSQFVESGGALVNAASFATGRASGGAKVAYPWYADARVAIAPYVGAYADYYFDNNGGAPLLLPTQFIRGGHCGPCLQHQWRTQAERGRRTGRDWQRLPDVVRARARKPTVLNEVRYWHLADIPSLSRDVRYRG
jgi:Autotransporter beta-domain